MRGVVCIALVVLPLVAGLVRSRRWLATQWSGPLGVVWCVVAGLLAGSVPALVAGARLGLFAALAVPLLAVAAVMLIRRAGPAAAALPGTASAQGSEAAATPGPTGAVEPPAAGAPAAKQEPSGAGLVVGPRATPRRATAPDPRAGPPKRGGLRAEEATETAAVPEAAQPPPRPVRPSPAAAALRAAQATAEGDKAPPPRDGAATPPTTVTECILSMSVSCEEYMLRNLHEMARAPLPESQRETLTRLIEETDDKLARLRAALRRHQGEELVRATWNQLPEVDLPVVKPGASLVQMREKAVRQTQVMIDFYRTVASYAQRPSLKGLLVNLALDGQRHLSVIEHTG